MFSNAKKWKLAQKRLKREKKRNVQSSDEEPVFERYFLQIPVPSKVYR
jgi:hypothetical protein